MSNDAAIWIDPARRSGEACISGTRIPVESVAAVVFGSSVDQAMYQWPQIERWHVVAACWYAAKHSRRYRSWKPWAKQWEGEMWSRNYEAVPDPLIADSPERAS